MQLLASEVSVVYYNTIMGHPPPLLCVIICLINISIAVFSKIELETSLKQEIHKFELFLVI